MVVARNKGRVRNKPDRVGPVGNSVELFQPVFHRNNFTDRPCERLRPYPTNDRTLWRYRYLTKWTAAGVSARAYLVLETLPIRRDGTESGRDDAASPIGTVWNKPGRPG